MLSTRDKLGLRTFLVQYMHAALKYANGGGGGGGGN